MGRDPAFLFYSGDFLTGVADLTFEERGQFITLMALQHQKGHLTKKLIQISVPNVSDDVMAKFKVDENNLYYNERLELEANKRKEHSKKQSQRALDGWKKRKEADKPLNEVGKATAYATALPLENEDVNESKKDVVINKGVYFQNEELNDLFLKWLHACAYEVSPASKRKLRGQSATETLAMNLSYQSEAKTMLQLTKAIENGWVNLQPIEEEEVQSEADRKAGDLVRQIKAQATREELARVSPSQTQEQTKKLN